MPFEIVKAPLPTRFKRSKYPFAQMKIGDSIFVHVDERLQRNIRVAMSDFNAVNDWGLKSIKLPDGRLQIYRSGNLAQAPVWEGKTGE